MNGIFNSGLSFWEFIGAVIAVTLAVITIKIAISFDVNKYLKRRDGRLNRKIKNICPHMHIEPAGKDDKGKPLFTYQSLFESPPGTHQWQCQRCGLVRNHDNDYEKRAEYYANNPKEYIKMNKKFEKLLKKGGAL